MSLHSHKKVCLLSLWPCISRYLANLSRKGINWENWGNFRELPGNLKNWGSESRWKEGRLGSQKVAKTHTTGTLWRNAAASFSHWTSAADHWPVAPVKATVTLDIGCCYSPPASMMSSPRSLHLYITRARFKVWVECLGQAWGHW